MPISLECGCGKRLRVGDHLAGKRAKCPGCGAVLDVPLADAKPLDLDVTDIVEVPPPAIPSLRRSTPAAPPRKKPLIPVWHWLVGAGIIAVTVVAIVLIRQAKNEGVGDDGEVASRRAPTEVGGGFVRPRDISGATTQPGRATTSPAGTWREFTSAAGGFSVMMPGTPVEGVRRVPSMYGGEIDFHTFLVEIGGPVYMVGYSDYSASFIRASDPERLVDAARFALVTQFGGHVESERAISLNGHPGHDVRLVAGPPYQGVTIHLRLCLVGRRLYQLIGSARPGSNSRDANRFLDSFRLLGN